MRKLPYQPPLSTKSRNASMLMRSRRTVEVARQVAVSGSSLKRMSTPSSEPTGSMAGAVCAASCNSTLPVNTR